MWKDRSAKHGIILLYKQVPMFQNFHLLCNYATDIDGCIISHITKSAAVQTPICFGSGDLSLFPLEIHLMEVCFYSFALTDYQGKFHLSHHQLQVIRTSHLMNSCCRALRSLSTYKQGSDFNQDWISYDHLIESLNVYEVKVLCL